MNNNLNEKDKEELLKGKGRFYTGIFVLLVIIVIIIIIGFLSILYVSFRNA